MTSYQGTSCIVVVGLNRSGTKWLSNILSQHSDIASITADHQFGILESNALNDLGRVFKSIDRDEDYFAFVNLWFETDLVRLSGLTKDRILRWDPRPASVADAFVRLLSEYSSLQGKSIWLQKASPTHVWENQRQFPPNTRYIVIQRDFIEVIQSSLELRRQTNVNTSFLRDLVANAIQSSLLRKFSKHQNCLSIEFSELKKNLGQCVRDTCDHIGIEFEENMLETPFRKNTSFSTSKRIPLKFSQRMVAKFLNGVLYILPATTVLNIWRFARRKSPLSIVRGSYDIFMEENGIRKTVPSNVHSD